MNLGTLLFSFEGRINRAKYWIAVLIYVAATAVLHLVWVVVRPESFAFSVSYLAALIVVFISAVAVARKRLHDRQKSGWWLLAFFVLPGVLVTVALVLSFFELFSTSGNFGTAIALGAAAAAIGIWAFIELGCLRGTVGPNRYGQDPLAAPAEAQAQ